MKALVLGTGSIGQRHIENLRLLNADIQFLLVRRAGRTDELSERIGARVFTEIAHALNEQPDFAVVATPSALHFEALVVLLDAGIPTYVEKPVVVTGDQVDRLVTLCGRVGELPTLVGGNLRFLPSLQQMREIVHSGRLGRIVRASFSSGQWLPDWRPGQDYTLGYSASCQIGGGVMFDLIHEVDVARWFFGEFDEVASMAGHLSELAVSVEDTACSLLRKSDGGPIVSVNVDYVSRMPVRRYEVVGDQGSLFWDLTTKSLLMQDAKGVHCLLDEVEDFDIGQTYVQAMRTFLGCVQGEEESPQDVWDGLASTQLVLSMKEAAGL